MDLNWLVEGALALRCWRDCISPELDQGGTYRKMEGRGRKWGKVVAKGGKDSGTA